MRRITNLTPKDTIDLADLTYVSGHTKATYSGNTAGGTLTVTNGTSTVSLTLVGNYTKSTWVLSRISTGGTLVVDPPATSSPPLSTLELVDGRQHAPILQLRPEHGADDDWRDG